MINSSFGATDQPIQFHNILIMSVIRQATVPYKFCTSVVRLQINQKVYIGRPCNHVYFLLYASATYSSNFSDTS